MATLRNFVSRKLIVRTSPYYPCKINLFHKPFWLGYKRYPRENTLEIGIIYREYRRLVLKGSFRNFFLAVHREIFSKYCWINPKSDCIYQFPIALEPNGRPFGSKSIGKWHIQSDFKLIQQDLENISHCVQAGHTKTRARSNSL